MKKTISYNSEEFNIEFINNPKTSGTMNILINGENNNNCVFIGGSGFDEQQLQNSVRSAIGGYINKRRNMEFINDWDGDLGKEEDKPPHQTI